MTFTHALLLALAIVVIGLLLYFATCLICPPDNWLFLVLGLAIILLSFTCVIFFGSNGSIADWVTPK